jgi:hypothetical protein
MLPRKKATQEGWISLQSRPPVGGWKVAVATCVCLLLLVGVNIRLFSRLGGAHGGVVAKRTHLSSSTPLFPKIIWTYWNDDNPRTVPKLVKLCAWTWQFLHPEWQFNWLTPATTAAYVSNFSAYQKAADSPARLADFVRLAVIAEHGGVWTDASILPLDRLDQWLTYPLDDDEDEADLLAAAALVNGDSKQLRQRPMTTTTTSRTKTATNATATITTIAPTTVFQLRSWNKLGPRYPLIESWFFAAPPHSPLMVAWKKQLDRLLHESVTDFLQENRDHGVDFQGIEVPEYLAIHVAVQRAIQDRPLLMYGVAVHDAEVGPYRDLATVHGWDPHRFCREYFVPGLNLPQQRQEKHWSSLDDALENTIILTQPEDKAAADAWIRSFTFDKRDLFIKLRSRERYPCEQLWNEAVSSSPNHGS